MTNDIGFRFIIILPVLKGWGGNKRQGAASNWRACHRAKEEVLNLI